ncbi:hypothetical protein ACQUFY_06320 [Robbsia andropogonis]
MTDRELLELAAKAAGLDDARWYQTAKKKKWLTRGEGSIDAVRVKEG